jgi:hypothetical protein
MGGKSPKAPDPIQTAATQTGYNMMTSGGSNIMNNPNTQDMYGNSNFTVDGYEEVLGPNGQKIKVPRYKQTTTLNKTGQEQFDSRNSLIKQLFGEAGGTSPSIGGNFLRPNEATMATDRSRVEQSIMDRANPLLQQNRDSEVARLAAMGLVPGGEKYGRVADQAGRNANDLALGAVAAGGQEQSRLLDLYNKGTGLMKDDRSNIINMLMGVMGQGQLGAQAKTAPNTQGIGGIDWTGAVQNKYGQDVSKYNNKMAGIGNIIKTGLSFL